MTDDATPGMTVTPIHFAGAEGNRLAGDLFTPPRPALNTPFLFLHGGGQTRHAWDRTARHLAGAGHTAIALHQRGHGESEWPASKRYAFRDFGADLRSVAAEIVAERGVAPVLVGASLGGMAGMIAAAHAPETAFSALVLVDITPWMADDGVARIQGFMRANMRDGFASLDEAADAIAAYLPERKQPVSRAGLRKNLRQGLDGRWRWHWDPDFLDGPVPVRDGYKKTQHFVLEGLRKVRFPVLLVRGRESDLITPAHAADFKALVPHSDFVDVAGAGHMVAGDQNDRFGMAITPFLTRNGLLRAACRAPGVSDAPESRLALFGKGAAPLGIIRRCVAGRDFGLRRLLRAGARVTRGQNRRFGSSKAQGRVLRHGRAKGHNRLFQRLARGDSVKEAHGLRLLRGEARARQENLARGLRAGKAHKVRDPGKRIAQAEPGCGNRDFRRVARNAKVTHCRKAEPAAEAKPVNLGDNRFRAGAQRLIGGIIGCVIARDIFKRVAVRVELGNVGAGAKRLPARAFQHDHAGVGVIRKRRHHARKTRPHGKGEGVAPRRAVNDDPANRALAAHLKFAVRHSSSRLFLHWACWPPTIQIVPRFGIASHIRRLMCYRKVSFGVQMCR